MLHLQYGMHVRAAEVKGTVKPGRRGVSPRLLLISSSPLHGRYGRQQQICMKFSLNEHTYLRHAGDETLLWNKRTYACHILKDAQGFLKPIEQGETKEIGEIIAEVAKLYALPPQEVVEDVQAFYAELATATFLNCDSVRNEVTPTMPMQKNAPPAPAELAEKEEQPFPVGTFYERHALPSSLHIDLTNACTERCIHCYIADYRPRFQAEDCRCPSAWIGRQCRCIAGSSAETAYH